MIPRTGHTTNQPFEMHLKHVHVPASSPCLPPFPGPSFFNPKEESDFDLGLHEIVPFVPCHFTTLFALYKFLVIQSLRSFNALLFHLQLDVVHFMKLSPSKKKVMSSSRSTSFLCRSCVEFFYGFLGMFHVEFIHPRSLYCMVSLPLD